jgi:hypothetical protein
VNASNLRRILAVAALAAAAFGSAAPASAAPTCTYTPKSVAGVTLGYCQPGLVCDDLCHWENEGLHCSYSGAVAQVGTVCRTVEGL